jgi:hypothetical protein
MFADPGGGQLRLHRLCDAIRKAQRDAGLPEWVTAHAPRHTHASILAQQGVAGEHSRGPHGVRPGDF